jgi:hypothetical protein
MRASQQKETAPRSGLFYESAAGFFDNAPERDEGRRGSIPQIQQPLNRRRFMSMRFWSGKLQIYEAIFVPEFNQDGHRAKKRTVSNETVHGVINQRERSLPSTAYQ